MPTARRCRAKAAATSLTGLDLVPGGTRLDFDEVLDAIAAATPLAYEEALTDGLATEAPDRARPHAVPPQRPRGSPGRSAGPVAAGAARIAGAARRELQARLHTRAACAASMAAGSATACWQTEGGYVHSEGDANWWIPSGRIFLSPDTADDPRRRTGVRAPALLPAAPLPRPVPPSGIRHRERREPTTPTTSRSGKRAMPSAIACQRGARLPRAAAAPDDRPQRQPHRGRLRCARHGGRHGGHGQGRRSQGRLAARASRRPRRGHSRSRISPIRFADPHGHPAARQHAAGLRPVRLPAHARRGPAATGRGLHPGPRNPRRRPGGRRADRDPAQLLLLRRLRPRDPEEDPGRARAARAGWSDKSARAGSAAAGRSSTTRASRSASTSRSSPTRTASSSTCASA